MLATEQGKEVAIQKLNERRAKNKGKERKRNDRLPAGWPMYYYCISCGEEISLPEMHWGAPPDLCKECQALRKCGWLE